MPENKNKQGGAGAAPRGRWQKGQSGNPGGKPKDIHGLRELARSYAPQAVATLVQIMTSAPKEADRRAAADSLLDRGFGRATQIVAGEEGAAPVRVEIRDLRAKPAE